MNRSRDDGSHDFRAVLVESYAVNERMNQIVLDHLDPAAWRAVLPGTKGRTIAAIVAHVHNIRRKWVRLSAPHIDLPATLERTRCTQKEAQAALAKSAASCSEMLNDAFFATRNEAASFLRDGWAKPWPAGISTVAYMITHEAHHRGQICMLAHQLGFPLPAKATSEMWGWEKLWKDCGFTHPR